MSNETLFQRERLKRFSRPVWTILIGTFLARCTFFMAWPFLIILLNDHFHASATTIGLMIEYWRPNVFFSLTVVLCVVMIALYRVIEVRAITRKIY